eukprot:GABV01013561.1.p2 GENE.GABV01013561.1~~GABV01013561.1.p2  ORF type:complete len:110 (-),score=44.06 GABV01013561.1:42-371(-)
MILLVFFVFTVHVIPSDSGILTIYSSYNLDIRYSQFFLLFQRSIQVFLTVFAFFFVSEPTLALVVLLLGGILQAASNLWFHKLTGIDACTIPAVTALRVGAAVSSPGQL